MSSVSPHSKPQVEPSLEGGMEIGKRAKKEENEEEKGGKLEQEETNESSPSDPRVMDKEEKKLTKRNSPIPYKGILTLEHLRNFPYSKSHQREVENLIPSPKHELNGLFSFANYCFLEENNFN